MRNKIYGGRWKLLESLGQGGQGHVFKVQDIQGDWKDQYALKRVINIKRRERFQREVEAIKTLSHPNIINLIDHSALDESEIKEEQFLVMPIARGSDLSKPDRIKLYYGDLHAVLEVAKQIASGLAAAHAKNIVHRDIKPQNILFLGASHDLWISDFGICLIRGEDRITESEEIVGARSFMAPELESGGVLDVTCKADIYALGKVIFYMYSGGGIIPRETILDSQFDIIFQESEPARRLRMLLAQMICKTEDRLNTIEEVTTRLRAIEAWERNALSLPIGNEGFKFIKAIQEKSKAAVRKENDEAIARERRDQIITVIKESFYPWIKGYLSNVAEIIEVAQEVKCVVGDFGPDSNPRWAAISNDRAYAHICGQELRLLVAHEQFKKVHRLQVRLCLEVHGKAVYSSGASSIAVGEDSGPRLAIIPYYEQTVLPHTTSALGFFTRETLLGQRRLTINNALSVSSFSIQPIMAEFNVDRCIHSPFNAEDWITSNEFLLSGLREAIDAFLAVVNTGHTIQAPY